MRKLKYQGHVIDGFGERPTYHTTWYDSFDEAKTAAIRQAKKKYSPDFYLDQCLIGVIDDQGRQH